MGCARPSQATSEIRNSDEQGSSGTCQPRRGSLGPPQLARVLTSSPSMNNPLLPICSTGRPAGRKLRAGLGAGVRLKGHKPQASAQSKVSSGPQLPETFTNQCTNHGHEHPLQTSNAARGFPTDIPNKSPTAARAGGGRDPHSPAPTRPCSGRLRSRRESRARAPWGPTRGSPALKQAREKRLAANRTRGAGARGGGRSRGAPHPLARTLTNTTAWRSPQFEMGCTCAKRAAQPVGGRPL